MRIRSAGGWLQHQPAVVAAALAGFFLVTVLNVTFPLFGTNDDVALMRLAAGWTTDKPTEFLIYTHILIGLALKGLYTASDTINWYGAYLYAVHFCAMTAIAYAIMAPKVEWWRILVVGVAFVAAWLGPLVSVMFTDTAIWAALAGALLMARCADEDFEPKRRVWWLAAALIVFAAMMRFKSAQLGVILAFPFLGQRLLATRSRTLVIALVATLIAAYGMKFAHTLYYQSSQGWGEYLEYNQVRSRLHDTPLLKRAPNPTAAFEKVGWSVNDARTLGGWILADEETYSAAKLHAVVHELEKQNRSYSESWRVFKRGLRKVDWVWPAALALLTLLCAARRWWFCALAVSYVALCLLLGAYLAHFQKVTPRVWEPLFNAPCVVFLLWLSTAAAPWASLRERLSRRELSAMALAATMVVALVGVGWKMVTAVRESRTVSEQHVRRFRSLDQVIARLYEAQKKVGRRVLFVQMGAVVPMDAMSPLQDLRRIKGVTIAPMGWATHSPHYHDVLKTFAVDDIYTAILERDDVVLIGRRTSAHYFSEFVREHRGVVVEFEKGLFRGTFFFKPRKVDQSLAARERVEAPGVVRRESIVFEPGTDCTFDPAEFAATPDGHLIALAGGAPRLSCSVEIDGRLARLEKIRVTVVEAVNGGYILAAVRWTAPDGESYWLGNCMVNGNSGEPARGCSESAVDGGWFSGGGTLSLHATVFLPGEIPTAETLRLIEFDLLMEREPTSEGAITP